MNYEILKCYIYCAGGKRIPFHGALFSCFVSRHRYSLSAGNGAYWHQGVFSVSCVRLKTYCAVPPRTTSTFPLATSLNLATCMALFLNSLFQSCSACSFSSYQRNSGCLKWPLCCRTCTTSSRRCSWLITWLQCELNFERILESQRLSSCSFSSDICCVHSGNLAARLFVETASSTCIVEP